MKRKKTNPRPLMNYDEWQQYKAEERKRHLALLGLVIMMAGALVLSILIG